jgi:hypothetical protein
MRMPRSTLGNVNGIRLVVMIGAMVSPMFCQDTGQPESKAMPAPKLPFLDWKAARLRAARIGNGPHGRRSLYMTRGSKNAAPSRDSRLGTSSRA